MSEQTKRRGKIIFFALLLCAFAFCLLHWRTQLYALITSAQARAAYIDRMRGTGAWGVATFLGLQLLQVFVAVIPGEPVEIMAGVLYGTFGGLLVCLAGALIGAVLIYYLMRMIGGNPLEKEKYQKYRVLQQPRRAEMLLFLLFLIPGTPKDMLLYVAPFLPIKARDYFLLVTIARIPSIVTSTFAGANLAQGDFGMMALVFVFTGAAGLLGIVYNEKLLAFWEKRRVRHKEETQALREQWVEQSTRHKDR